MTERETRSDAIDNLSCDLSDSVSGGTSVTSVTHINPRPLTQLTQRFHKGMHSWAKSYMCILIENI